MDAAALADAGGAVADHLLGEALAGPLEVVDADVVELARVVAAMRAEALAGDQLGLAVAVDVGPDQVGGLRVVGIYGVLVPGALAALATLLPPVEAVAVRLADDEIGEAVAVDVGDDHRHRGAAEVELLRERPLAAPRSGGRRLQDALRRDELALAVAVDVA